MPKVPPHDLDAERGILGAALLDGGAIDRAQELVTDLDFYWRKHQVLFRAICQLAAAAQPVDLITLGEKLESMGNLEMVGGRAGVAELITEIPSASNIAHHSKIVRQCAELRHLISLTQSIQDRAYRREPTSALLGDVERALYDLRFGRYSGEWINLAQVVRESIEAVDKASTNQTGITGVPSGFRTIDSMLAGWQASDLILIAAS